MSELKVIATIGLAVLMAGLLTWLVLVMLCGIAYAWTELRGWGSSFRSYRRHRAEIDEIIARRKEIDQ